MNNTGILVPAAGADLWLFSVHSEFVALRVVLHDDDATVPARLLLKVILIVITGPPPVPRKAGLAPGSHLFGASPAEAPGLLA
ncbi:hypothetical protein [Pseudarthrobacter sp. NPDC080039]|uniref:hypothetical protein n=1 Tax=unclassified Pseudarthrobacter TaxID=2647000 RepID=UPI0034503A5B